MENIIEGKIGEASAFDFLKKNGYTIVQTNFKNKIGEVDIIAYDNKAKYLVFVEVKKRASLKFGYPREAVNYHKQNKIRQVALSYLQRYKKLNENVRFDVIEILGEEITHIKNAF